MTEQEYEHKQSDLDRLPEATMPEKKPPEVPSFEVYLSLLEAMQRPRRHLTTPPTFVPKNFAEQIQFYDDEAGVPVRRSYFYFNGAWSYITLT